MAGVSTAVWRQLDPVAGRLSRRSAPEGMRFYSGRDPYAIEWQRRITEERCP